MAVVPGAGAVADVLRDAGYTVVEIPSVSDVDVQGESSLVAVFLRWPVRHVGLGELGIPVLALIDAEGDVDTDIADAQLRGAHDVVLTSASDGEVVARVRAAERTAAGMRHLFLRSKVDELTGLANRRHMDEHLEMMSAMARRQRSSFSLLLIDVDRTRRVNDEYGERAGDTVLAEVAHRIVVALRTEDVAGRWHGEEFVVLLPHTELDGAWRLADRIRASVCDAPIDLGDGRDVMVTVSIGVAEAFGDDADDHLRRAQAAVDEAKAAGRNKVVADTSPVLS